MPIVDNYSDGDGNTDGDDVMMMMMMINPSILSKV